MNIKNNRKNRGQLRIIAHRGANYLFPENSIPAFAKAIELRVDEIEFDLWETTDGRVVVSHDPELGRTTDGEGYCSKTSRVGR